MEWERPGLAGISVFYADNSIVCFYGKDPAVLRDIDRSQTFSEEYAKRVLERYAICPNVVQVLDGTTGLLRASSEIPSYLTPVTLLRESLSCEGPTVVVEERHGDGICRLVIFSAAGGEAVLTVDWADVMPGINVTQALVLPDGIVVAGSNGSVSLLNRELEVLWTGFPKGAKNNRDARIELLGSPGGNMVAVATYFIPIALWSPLHPEAEVQLSVFDGNGNTLLTHSGLKRLINTRSGKIRATAKTGKATTDYLYVFDLTGDHVKISRPEIPGGDQYA